MASAAETYARARRRAVAAGTALLLGGLGSAGVGVKDFTGYLHERSQINQLVDIQHPPPSRKEVEEAEQIHQDYVDGSIEIFNYSLLIGIPKITFFPPPEVVEAESIRNRVRTRAERKQDLSEERRVNEKLNVVFPEIILGGLGAVAGVVVLYAGLSGSKPERTQKKWRKKKVDL